MIRVLVPGLFALLTLAACGGGNVAAVPTAPTPTVDPVVFTRTLVAVGTNADDLSRPPSYDPQTDTFRFLPGTVSGGPLTGAVLSRVSDAMMPANFAAYNDGTSFIRGVRGATAGGAAYVIRRDGIGYIQVYERLGTTVLPPTGGGVFNGTYAGTLGTSAAENRGTITGVVELQVDFANAVISGEIDDRVNQNGRRFEPLTLGTTVLRANGTFLGQISGGQSPFLGHTTTIGFYDGAVVGATGTGVVGTAGVMHQNSPTMETLQEAGAFVAERP